MNFYDQTGSRFLEPIFFTNHYHRTEILPLEFRKYLYYFSFYWRKTGFRRPFWIFTTEPEVEFSNLYILQITTIDHENLPLKIWKYLNYFSSYLRKNGFRRLFWIFTTKPEVEFSNLYFLLISTIELENLPLEFRKYFN